MSAKESSLWKPGLASRDMVENWKKYHIHFYTLEQPFSLTLRDELGLDLGWSKVVNFMFLHSKFAIFICSKKLEFMKFIRYLLSVWFCFVFSLEKGA